MRIPGSTFRHVAPAAFPHEINLKPNDYNEANDQ
jgi:hypothetical protein